MGVIKGFNLMHKIVELSERLLRKRNGFDMYRRSPNSARKPSGDRCSVISEKIFDIKEETELENLMEDVYQKNTCVCLDATALLFCAKMSLTPLLNFYTNLSKNYKYDLDDKKRALWNCASADKKASFDNFQDDNILDSFFKHIPERSKLEAYIFNKFLGYQPEEEYKFLAYDYETNGKKNTGWPNREQRQPQRLGDLNDHFLSSFYFYFLWRFAQDLKKSLKFDFDSNDSIKYLIFFIDKGYIGLKKQERDKRKLKRLKNVPKDKLSVLLKDIMDRNISELQNNVGGGASASAVEFRDINRIPDHCLGAVLKLVCEKIPFWSLVKFLQEPYIMLFLVRYLNLESVYVANFDSNEADVDMSRFCQFAKYGICLRDDENNAAAASYADKRSPPGSPFHKSSSEKRTDSGTRASTAIVERSQSTPKFEKKTSLSLFDAYLDEKKKELSVKSMKRYFVPKNFRTPNCDQIDAREYSWRNMIERLCASNVRHILLYGTDVDMVFFPSILEAREKAIVSEILERRKKTPERIVFGVKEEPKVLVLQKRQNLPTSRSRTRIYFNKKYKMYDVFSTEFCFYNLSELLSTCFSGVSAVIWSLLCGSDYAKPIIDDLEYSRRDSVLQNFLKFENEFCLCPVEIFVRVLKREEVSQSSSFRGYKCKSCEKKISEKLEATATKCLSQLFKNENGKSFSYLSWYSAMKRYTGDDRQFLYRADFSFVVYNIVAIVLALMVNLNLDECISFNHAMDNVWKYYAKRKLYDRVKTKNGMRFGITRSRDPRENNYEKGLDGKENDDDGGGPFDFLSSSSSSSSSSSPPSCDEISGSEGNEETSDNDRFFKIPKSKRVGYDEKIEKASLSSLPSTSHLQNLLGGGERIYNNNPMIAQNVELLADSQEPQHLLLELIRYIVEYIAGTAEQHEMMKRRIPQAHVLSFGTNMLFYHTAKYIRDLPDIVSLPNTTLLAF